MENSGRRGAFAGICVFVLLGGCQVQSASEEEKTSECVPIIRCGALQVTSTMIELRCEITNCSERDIWVYDSAQDVPDRDVAGCANATVCVGTDDRTLVVAGGIGKFYGREIWCDMGASYTRLHPQHSTSLVLRALLPIPDYLDKETGLFQARRGGVDHLTRVAFQIGYFTEKDLTSFKTTPESIHRISVDGSGNHINVYDSSQGALCGAEQTVRMVLDGVYLPLDDLRAEDKGGQGGEPRIALPQGYAF